MRDTTSRRTWALNHLLREVINKVLYEGYDFQKEPIKVIQPLPKYLRKVAPVRSQGRAGVPALAARRRSAAGGLGIPNG